MPRDYCTGGLTASDYGCTNSIPEIRIPQPTRESCTPKELRIKEVNIKQLDHGYLLNVGCKTIALSSAEELLFGLKKYLKDPYKTQELFEKGEFRFEK